MYTYTEIFKEDVEQASSFLEEAAVPNQQMQAQIDPKAKCAELISRAFAARNAMHFFHLKTPLYSAHIAAQGFYEGIIPLIDSFAEGVIGRLGKFEVFPNIKESTDDGLAIVGNMVKWIDTNRAMLTEFSEVQNIIDEIISLCNSTAYKLRELR